MGTFYINGKPFDVAANMSPSLQNCDGCNTWKSVTGGRTIYLAGEVEAATGEAIAWICADCLRN